MLEILDLIFILFHTFLIIFNLMGWIWKKTRKLNLISLFITGFSWFVLGLFYGWGYCFLTDWHWSVLEKAGIQNLPNSYIQYLYNRIFGLHIGSNLADYLTVSLFVLALIMSIYFNLKKVTKA